ncbi:hypothetical protein ILYODFUR_038592, partial [Ilyodon furcidens]
MRLRSSGLTFSPLRDAALSTVVERRSRRSSHSSSTFNYNIMKTLILSLGMLLLIACCCNAMHEELQYNTCPVECCNKFSSVVIPKKYVSEIKKTHHSCMLKGF